MVDPYSQLISYLITEIFNIKVVPENSFILLCFWNCLQHQLHFLPPAIKIKETGVSHQDWAWVAGDLNDLVTQILISLNLWMACSFTEWIEELLPHQKYSMPLMNPIAVLWSNYNILHIFVHFILHDLNLHWGFSSAKRKDTILLGFFFPIACFDSQLIQFNFRKPHGIQDHLHPIVSIIWSTK